MDAYRNQAERAWEYQAFNLLLTIDHLEAIVREFDYESFCDSPAVVRLVTATLQDISMMVRRIPIHVRLAHPDVPWPFLRSLDALLDVDMFAGNPAGAWRILNSRIIPGATPLAPLVSRIDLNSLRSA